MCDVLPLKIRLANGSIVRFCCAAVAANPWVNPATFDGRDVAFLRDFLRPGDTFVDVGANIGVYSMYAASSVGPNGRVLAIEPHPRTWRQLSENLRVNGYCWAEAICGAASDKNSMLRLTDIRSDDQNALVAGGPIPVMTARLDNLVPARPVRLLKIDVEGHEAAVLAGAIDVLGRTDAVLVEAWVPTEPKSRPRLVTSRSPSSVRTPHWQTSWPSAAKQRRGSPPRGQRTWLSRGPTRADTSALYEEIIRQELLRTSRRSDRTPT